MEIPDSLLTQTEEIFLMLIKEGLCDSIGHTLNAKEEEDFSSKMKAKTIISFVKDVYICYVLTSLFFRSIVA